MNYTLHSIGATGFFIMILIVFGYHNKAVLKFWSVKPHFINLYSYLYKKNIFLFGIILLGIDILSKIFKHEFPHYTGNIIEWTATFAVLIYLLTLALDLKDISVYFVNK